MTRLIFYVQLSIAREVKPILFFNSFLFCPIELIEFVCIYVAICDLVHGMETVFGPC